jgi:hypothetical protein
MVLEREYLDLDQRCATRRPPVCRGDLILAQNPSQLDLSIFNKKLINLDPMALLRNLQPDP